MRLILLLALALPLQGCVFVVMGAMAVYGVSKAVYEAKAEHCEKGEGRCVS